MFAGRNNENVYFKQTIPTRGGIKKCIKMRGKASQSPLFAAGKIYFTNLKEGPTMPAITFYKHEPIPMEMHKVKIVQQLQLLPTAQRLQKMQQAGFNTFQLHNGDIFRRSHTVRYSFSAEKAGHVRSAYISRSV